MLIYLTKKKSYLPPVLLVLSPVTQAIFVRVVVVKITLSINVVEMVEKSLNCEKKHVVCHTMHCGGFAAP